MLRLLAWVILILAVPGCQSAGGKGASTDPFFGRTRVEPPRTGALSAAPTAGGSPNGAAPGSAVPSPLAGQGVAGYPPVTNWPSSAPGSGGTSPSFSNSQPAWSAAQAKPNPVPAAISPQPASGLTPPSGGFGFPATRQNFPPNNGGTNTSGGFGSPGAGDRISIPTAARTLNDRARDSISRSESPSSQGVTASAVGANSPNFASPTAAMGMGAVGGQANQLRPTNNSSLPANSSGGGSSLRVTEPGGSSSLGARPYVGSMTPNSAAASPPAVSNKSVDFNDLPDASP